MRNLDFLSLVPEIHDVWIRAEKVLAALCILGLLVMEVLSMLFLK
jgi:hypothetical protein